MTTKRVSGRIKRLDISGELFVALLTDGYEGHYRVEKGVPKTAKFVYGYYDEPYVGAGGIFSLILEDESFEWYEGEIGRCPSLSPIVYSLSD